MIYHMMRDAGAAGAGGTAMYYGNDPMAILGMLAMGKAGSSALNSKLLARYAQQGLGQDAKPIVEALGRSAPYLIPAAANAAEQ
jgi:hypothetical protein